MNFSKYKNTFTYPNCKDYSTTYYYKNGKVVATVTTGSLSIVDYSTKETVIDEEKFKKAEEEYYAEERRLADMFINDLFDDLGISDNPKRHLLYSKAYDYSHSDDYEEIYNVACNLVYLIKE